MNFYCYTFKNFITVVYDFLDLFGTNYVKQLEEQLYIPENSFYITSKWEFENYDIIKDILLKNKNSKVIVDVSEEGNSDVADYEPILDFYIENNIDTDNIIFLTNNYVVKGITKYNFRNYTFNLLHYSGFLNKFLQPHRTERIIGRINNDAFVLNEADVRKIYFDFDDVFIKSPSTDFLILNRTLKDYKLKVLESAWKQNLFKEYKIRYTLLNLKHCNLNNFDFEFQKFLFDDYGNFTPVQLPDESTILNSMPFDKINSKWLFDSKVNIVVESTYEDENMKHYDDMIHLSEKTWRCLFYGVPFVISSNKNCLKAIREYGFKTFDSVINESYDTLNDSDRINGVLFAAKDLLKKWDSDEVRKICGHNRTLYKNKKHKRKWIERNFLNHLENWK